MPSVQPSSSDRPASPRAHHPDLAHGMCRQGAARLQCAVAFHAAGKRQAAWMLGCGSFQVGECPRAMSTQPAATAYYIYTYLQ